MKRKTPRPKPGAGKTQKFALGYSPGQITGAGSHGGGQQMRNKRDRKASKESLRRGQWE